ncbi:MAG: adenylyltransferase/cytidyltransferase family protein [Candidatus Nealsonbacteria bacterium]|nr:adenylyltransferase/cytidyltransferase family protein [Candidatus Nealsonbacteria bacterium]
MKAIFVYPGTFCPPTYGHLQIVKKAAEILPEVVVICSVNPDKNDNWFSPEECKDMWSAYDLPENVSVKTLDGFKKEHASFSTVVMIRGIRDDADLEYEKGVIFLNQRTLGIDKYLYILSNDDLKDISSSGTRKAALDQNTISLYRQVAPQIVAKLLEKAMEVKWKA